MGKYTKAYIKTPRIEKRGVFNALIQAGPLFY